MHPLVPCLVSKASPAVLQPGDCLLRVLVLTALPVTQALPVLHSLSLKEQVVLPVQVSSQFSRLAVGCEGPEVEVGVSIAAKHKSAYASCTTKAAAHIVSSPPPNKLRKRNHT
eukprot:2295677-Amphidinium_carterae.1